jgi:hypothetical protein
MYVYRWSHRQDKLNDKAVESLQQKYPINTNLTVAHTIHFTDILLEPGAIGTIIDHSPCSVGIKFEIGNSIFAFFWMTENLIHSHLERSNHV